jgi:hypothetical protein
MDLPIVGDERIVPCALITESELQVCKNLYYFKVCDEGDQKYFVANKKLYYRGTPVDWAWSQINNYSFQQWLSYLSDTDQCEYFDGPVCYFHYFHLIWDGPNIHGSQRDG